LVLKPVKIDEGNVEDVPVDEVMAFEVQVIYLLEERDLDPDFFF
jgi:hypothetical protein